MGKGFKIFILIIVLAVAGVAYYDLNSSYTPSPKELDVKIEKSYYSQGESLRLNVKNHLSEKVCFSSCYPYFLEKREDGKWVRYEYSDCPEENVNEICIFPKELKGFKISLDAIEPGVHRVVIPVSDGREEGEEFQEIKKVSSDKFMVSK